MRVDALGLFWQDMPKIKKEKDEEKYLAPEPTWRLNTFLPYLKEARLMALPMLSDQELMTAVSNKHPLVFDIECYINYFLIAFKDTVTNKYIYFERVGTDYGDSDWNDDPRKLIWIMNYGLIVGFNSIGYDMPIAIMAMAGKSVAQMKAATNMIIGEGFKPWQVLRKLKLKNINADHIDIMEVTPLAGSLKIYGGRAGTRKMQDLPIHPEVELTPDQISVTRYYCFNDLDTTHDVYNKVKKDIDLREEMSKEYSVDLRSKSDAQIAEAVIAHELTKMLGHKPSKPVIEPGTAYRYRIPDWMGFQTPLMNGVLDILRETIFVVSEKGSVGLPPQLANLKININESTYTMGIGGLHSTEKKTSHFSDDLYQLSDHDVTSYYPFIILNNNLYPQHLGPAFLHVFRSIVQRRLAAKNAAKEYGDKAKAETDPTKKAEYEQLAKDSKRTADSLKIVINGTFGKLGSKWSIFYSPDLLIQTTITGQLALLMMIETFELNGIQVISANTDGIVIKCPRSKTATRDAILDAWQKQTNFELEASYYRALCSRDVNNYFAVKQDGGVKGKGAYSDPGLRKNAATTICTKAVAEFLEHGTPIETYIRNCTNIMDFISIRNVTGGAVSVKYVDPGPEGKVKLEDMEAQLLKTGWVKYEGGTWIKQSWIDNNEPYDRMAVSLRIAYGQARWTPVHYEYLGKAVRWYYAIQPEGTLQRMIYAKNGKKVPKSDGAIPLMEMDGALPKDLDYAWYVEETNRILKDIGYPI
ncbi:MAG: hypothetical protein CMO80_21975 [Verrucomicrobiales bacterium]|nr:hypothetical protein [Verrucomicrobiales bacterium]